MIIRENITRCMVLDDSMPNKNTLVEELKRVFDIKPNGGIPFNIEILIQHHSLGEYNTHYFNPRDLYVVLTESGFLECKRKREFVIWWDIHDIYIFEPSITNKYDRGIVIPYHELAYVEVKLKLLKKTL